MRERFFEDIIRRRWLEVALLLALVLAFTLPFINQAVHHDAQLDLDWARQELEHPWWQHIPDYDYFGFHYSEFHDTHPRLQSLYLSLLLRLNGGEASEALLHLAMIPFPLMAALSMYWLARRFRANAFVATLLLLISPAFLANTHLIMKDIPGIALWLAGLAFFIAGTDRDRLVYTLLGGLSFAMSIFVFYQGLAVLPLAFLYLVLQRRISAKPIAGLAVPVVAFAAFVSAHMAYYGAIPTFTYPEPIGLPFTLYYLWLRVRGAATVLGGAFILPGLAIWLFPRSKASIYATGGVFAFALFGISLLYMSGAAPLEQILLVPVFAASGFAIAWSFTASLLRTVRPALLARHGQDSLFLSTWFLGVLFYCSVLMPYASPRFMIPLLPPLAMITAGKIQERWGASRERFVLAITLIAVATFILAMLVALAENQRANYNRDEARWVHEQLGDSLPYSTIWYSGYLGFQYYLEPYNYRMLMVNENEPAEGDIIVETLYNGRWTFRPNLSKRLKLLETVDFPRSGPVITFNTDTKASWVGTLNLMVPYGFEGRFVERMYVYRVACTPGQVLSEDEPKTCVPYEETEDDRKLIERLNKL